MRIFAKGLCLGLFIGSGLIGMGCWGSGPLGRGSPNPPALKPSADPAWYTENAPLMIEYLQTLPATAKGQPLAGILLSDQKRWLKDAIYLGQPRGLPQGLQVRLIRVGEETRAYAWVEKAGSALLLEPCSEGPQRGIRARRAGGGLFAWKQLKPGEGLVYTICPPSDWLPPPPKAPAAA